MEKQDDEKYLTSGGRHRPYPGNELTADEEKRKRMEN
jgi:hypothetical protein